MSGEKKPEEWISGKEIMAVYGKAATEIGQECYDGVLHAYIADVLMPVLEKSKIARIPTHPPVGVDPYDHIQYTATPSWDWSPYVKIDLMLVNPRLCRGTRKV